MHLKKVRNAAAEKLQNNKWTKNWIVVELADMGEEVDGEGKRQRGAGQALAVLWVCGEWELSNSMYWMY